MTRVLGLDLSLTATGVAWEGGTAVISFKKLRGMERIDAILQALSDYVDTAVHGRGATDVVVLEGYSFGSQGRAVYDIAELGGCVRFALYERSLPYVEIAPQSLKKFATGKGNVGKDEVLAAAIRRFGFAGTNNNEADAWILYKMGDSHYADPHSVVGARVTDYQREALAKVEWPDLHLAEVAQ